MTGVETVNDGSKRYRHPLTQSPDLSSAETLLATVHFSDTCFLAARLDPAVHMMIPRTQPLPAVHTEIFTTVVDNQTTLEITVLQGESNRASQNKVLGSFELVDIPPARCAEQQIAVTFGAQQHPLTCLVSCRYFDCQSTV